MLITFVLGSGDSVFLIRTLYSLCQWLMENKEVEVIIYLPNSNKLDLFSQKRVEIRWYTNILNPEEVPSADIIISTQFELLQQLNSLHKGELVYLKQQERERCPLVENISIITLNNLKPGLPSWLFKKTDRKRNKIIISGDGLDREKIRQLFTTFEKVSSTVFTAEIIILDFHEEFFIDTELDYQFVKSKDIEIMDLFASSFYLVYLRKYQFPLLPLWAIAAGVIVLNVNLLDNDHFLPLEFDQLDPVELAVNMIKIFKLGNLRTEIKNKGEKILKPYQLKQSAGKWYEYFTEFVKPPLQSTPVNINSDLTVDLVIINYNTKNYLQKCLESIDRFTDLSYKIIIVDNGSTDGSKEFLAELTDDKIKIIDNEENLGYARACNQGILAGKGDYIILLNSDIEVTEGWVEPLIETALDPKVAVVGPKLINKSGKIVGAGVTELDESFIPRGWKEEDGEEIFADKEEVISVGGACYLLKRELLPKIGLFDEEYFFYFEELDYSLRANEKGYQVIYCPQSKIYHQHEGSLKKGDSAGKLKRKEYYQKGKKRFYHKWSKIMDGFEKREEPKTIIIGGLIPWNFRQQRPQHLARNLVQKGCQILYLNPVCNDSGLQEVEENIYVFNPPGYGSVLFNLISGNEQPLGRGVNNIIQELGFENSFIILDAPYWTPLIKFWEHSLLVYDCMDNYIHFQDLLRHRDWILNNENKLLKYADFVITSAEGLYRKLKAKNKKTYLLPNGVDRGHFNYQFVPEKRPADLPAMKNLIGYYGAISDWFDLNLVFDLAQSMPNVGIILIGEVTTDIGPLNQLENVFFLGEKSYYDLPSYLYYFDLAIIPFKENELTRVTDPVKVYEYLSAGKKILTTKLPELEKFSDVITIASDRDEFINLAEELVKKQLSLEEQIDKYDFVEDKTWCNRATTLYTLLHQKYINVFSSRIETETEMKQSELITEDDKVNGVKADDLMIDEADYEYQESAELKAESSQKNWLDKLKEWFGNIS